MKPTLILEFGLMVVFQSSEVTLTISPTLLKVPFQFASIVILSASENCNLQLLNGLLVVFVN